MKSRPSSVAISVFGLCLGFTGCSDNANSAPPQQGPPAMPVKLEATHLQRISESTEYLATLQSRSSSTLRPDVEGQIVKILVKSGDQVKAGTPLIEIDPRKQEATFRSQEASQRARTATLEWNRAELERRKKLFEAGVISRQELEQAQTTYDASKADVEATSAAVQEQQVQLRYFVVRAPSDGVVGDIPVRVGDRVQNTTVLTTVDRGTDLEAYISIPADKATAVHVGTGVELLDATGKPVEQCKVTFISPRVDPDNQLLLIKATVPNKNRQFRNDQVVHARLIWGQHNMPMIPVTSVVRISGQTFAFVADSKDGQAVARQRAVRLGEVVGNNYVVLEGLNAGDKIIVSGTQNLADGMPIIAQS